MSAARGSIGGWVVGVLTIHLLAAFNLYSDVIYLKDGNILLAEQAWEEGDEVKYRTRQGILSLPKASVQEIRQEKPMPPAAGASRWVRVSPDGPGGQAGSATATAPSAPAVTGGTGAAISKEALTRLRNNLSSDRSDPIAKSELAQALNSMAALQVAQGDLASAQSSLEEALEIDRRNPALLSNLAAVHFRMGNYQKTESLLLECLEIDRKDQRTFLLLGEAYYKLEKIPQAIRYWKEGLELGPNDAISQRLQKAGRESPVHEELGVLKSVHFILRYDKTASSYQLGEQILIALEDLYRRLSNELTSQAPETVAVILYTDQAYFDITRAPGWSGGVYDGKIRIPIRGLYSITPELRAALAHELTHCFMLALPGRGSPAWFLEGVAQVQEGKSAAGDRKMLAQLQRGNGLIPLKDLRDSLIGLQAASADLAYTESLSAVEYLIARFGRSSIRNLLALMGNNYNFETAFNTELQRSIAEFEAAWHRALTQ